MSCARRRILSLAVTIACGQPASNASDAGGGDASRTEAGPPDSAVDAGVVVTGTLQVTPSQTVAPLPAKMAGLSYEKAHLTNGFFTGSNAPLIALFKLLGPGLLRIGGNSVDTTTWYTAAPADAGVSAAITRADVDDLAAFAKQAGWSVLYGVNMKTSNPALAAAEATYAASALGANLYGFEIGNEVDLYKSTALSSTWSYATFKTQWESFDGAVKTSVTGASMTGPASASHYASWTVPFAADEGARIDLLTQHYYRGDGKAATSTMDELLLPDPALITELQALSTAVSGKSVSKYRLAECNSFYGGGAPGVSDAFGSALWAIDFLFTNARYGSSGGNFHGGGNGPGYTPIADSNGTVVGVRPIFYGLLFFTKIGAGNIVSSTVTLKQNLNFTAYAVQAADKSMNVVIVNKDPTATVHLMISGGTNISAANVLRLQAPALDSTTGVTLGGASIDPTGSWNPAAPQALPVSGQTITVDVPPVSAALVHGAP